MGYRGPKADAHSPENGGDGRLDVYLADIGDAVYGYCASDDPDVRRSSASAYCVVDDDLATQFRPTSRLAALEVTAAHEFFHAVQFSYDSSRTPGSWKARLRGSRTRCSTSERQPPVSEREPARTLDDPARRQLRAIPLRRLDLLALPVREIRLEPCPRGVEQADGSRGGGGLYSLAATRAAVSARGLSFGAVFGGSPPRTECPPEPTKRGRYTPSRPPRVPGCFELLERPSGWRSFPRAPDEPHVRVPDDRGHVQQTATRVGPPAAGNRVRGAPARLPRSGAVGPHSRQAWRGRRLCA